MELLGDEAQVDAHFISLGDNANLNARQVHGLHQTYHRLRIHFGRTRWYSKVTRLKWKLDSIHLEIVLILTEDSCTICTERTIGSEIILDALDVTPR
jgi:hypothetical protein